MSYTALYRKFRPDSFADVKGQDAIVTTLRNQIRANRIGHAYLFTGTRGTGKTTVAKILAKTVNCEHPTEDGPCGTCATCQAIASGSSMNVIEIDAASNNGVDNIREIVEEVSYSPTQGRYKVYIIDEVHMLSTGAFNALLKTLEEPPSYVIFILATTEVHKLPITILSRCQRYDFKRITIDEITGRMRELIAIEGVDVEDKALRYIAKTADGSMRDALSLLDQCIAFHLGQTLTYDKVLDVLGAVDTGVFSRLLRAVLSHDVIACIELLEEVVMQGRELTQFVTDFTWYLRNLLLVQSSDGLEDVIDMSSENLANLREEATQVETEQIIRYIYIFSEFSGRIRYASQKRILVEIALIKLCKPQMETDSEAVLDRIRQVEERVEQGAGATLTPEQLAALAAAGAAGVGGAGGPNGAGGTGGAGGMGAKARPTLDRAIPEEVQEVVAKWGSICSEADMPMKLHLQSAKLSLGGDNRLIVAVEDGPASDYFRPEKGTRERLEAQIAALIGKEVSVEIRILADRQEFEENYVDLAKIVHMEIEEED